MLRWRRNCNLAFTRILYCCLGYRGVYYKRLKDAHTPAIAGSAARDATPWFVVAVRGREPKLRTAFMNLREHFPNELRLLPVRICLLAALTAECPHETLRNRDGKRRTQDFGIYSQVYEAGDGPRGVVGVERTEDEMPRERRVDSNLGGFFISDFTHHNNVRVLSQGAPKSFQDRISLALLNLCLIDSLHMVLNRVLNRDYFIACV